MVFFIDHYYIIRLKIAIQKVLTDFLTVEMLSKNFKETLKEFIATDKAIIMSSAKGILAYWKQKLLQTKGTTHGKTTRYFNQFYFPICRYQV